MAERAAASPVRAQGLPGRAWSSFSGVLPVASDRMDSRLCFCASTSRHLMCTSMAWRCPVGGSRGCCSMAAQQEGKLQGGWLGGAADMAIRDRACRLKAIC